MAWRGCAQSGLVTVVTPCRRARRCHGPDNYPQRDPPSAGRGTDRDETMSDGRAFACSTSRTRRTRSARRVARHARPSGDVGVTVEKCRQCGDPLVGNRTGVGRRGTARCSVVGCMSTSCAGWCGGSSGPTLMSRATSGNCAPATCYNPEGGRGAVGGRARVPRRLQAGPRRGTRTERAGLVGNRRERRCDELPARPREVEPRRRGCNSSPFRSSDERLEASGPATPGSWVSCTATVGARSTRSAMHADG